MPQSMGELEYETQSRNHDVPVTKKKEKRWTLGSLFRRRKTKDSDTESSDSDAAEDGKKRGFLARRRKRRSTNRGSKDVSQSFEHVILRPGGGNVSSDSSRKSLKARVEANRDSLLKDSSSEEERSPRPRVPRSKRSSRDMTDCQMKVMELDSSPRSPRWTAKVVYCESSDYEARYTAHTRSATPSPAQSPIAKVKHLKRPPIPQASASRPLNCQKSASFDLLPRQLQSQHTHPPHPRMPPPPPPRDPQRKILPPLGYQQDRPLSYAFESNQPKLVTDHNSNITAYNKMNSNCSLDHQPVYKINSSISLDHQSNSYKMSSSCSLDQPSYRTNSSKSLDQPMYNVNGTGSWDKRRTYQYYTDQQPRSRRPIHITRVDQPYLSDSQVGRINMNDWRMPRESNSSLCDSSDSREGGVEPRPLSMVIETAEHVPQQYYSLSKAQQEPVIKVEQFKRKSGNLEDALNELEAIYKSLQLRDEESTMHRGFESDSGFNYRVVDDMAYRRLNRRDSGGSPDCRTVMSQAGSYLLVSPTLSPPPFANAPPIQIVQNEPDITLDDVVYRNIRHTNNTLKISDPQPLFGIPLGPITPAPNSDYLHATPKHMYRPTFKPRKTPDIVKDDLAYRNLRKDSQHDSLLSREEFLQPTHEQNPTSILKKKRAVRSLSANLLNIIQQEQNTKENQNNTVNYMDFDRNSCYEKTQSYSDLPDILNLRYKRFQDEDEDVTPRASRVYSELPISTTSTETLTDSRANIFLNESQSIPIRYQYLPLTTTNKLLPKTQTDCVKVMLPSSHRVSSPKKHSQKVDDSNKISGVNSSSEILKQRTGYSGTVHSNNSSPNHSLRLHQLPSEKNSLNHYSYSTDRLPSNRLVSHDNKCNSIKSGSSAFQEVSHNRINTVPQTVDRVHIYTPYRTQDEFKPQINSYVVNNSTDALISTQKRISKDLDSQIKPSVTRSTTLHNNNKSPRNNVMIKTLSSSEASQVNDNIGEQCDADGLNIPRNNSYENITSSRKQKINMVDQSDKSEREVNGSNRISIEGVKINVTSLSKNKSSKDSQVNTKVDSKPQKNSTEVKPHKMLAIDNKPKIVSHHEKSHLKNDVKIQRASNQIAEQQNGNGGNRLGKLPAVRPRSTTSTIDGTALDKFTSTSPKPAKLTSTSEKEKSSKLLSSHLSVNNGERVKSKSASPRLSVKSSSSDNLIPYSPNTNASVKSEKSCNNKRTVTSNSLDNVSVNVTDSDEKLHAEITTKPKETQASNKVNRRKMKGKSLSLNSGLSVEDKSSDIKQTRLTKAFSISGSIHSDMLHEDNREFITDNSEVSDINPINDCYPTSSLLLTKSVSNQSPNKTTNVVSGNDNKPQDVEKDLKDLLTEINKKQDIILAASKPCTNSSSMCEPSSNTTDKSLMLGKISPHKPVKLTTFSISDNNTIENKETIVRQNDTDILGTSESMTDLLRELTRSLDQDFGSLVTAKDAQEGKMNCKCLSEQNRIDVVEKAKVVLDYTDDELAVDEADNEVMEINRKVLSELKKQNTASSVECSTTEIEPSTNNEKEHVSENQESSDDGGLQVTNATKLTDSDDSNTEFVEAICKTASEISAISSNIVSGTTTAVSHLPNGIASSSHQEKTENHQQISSPPDGFHWKPKLDQNEGTTSTANSNNKLDCSRLVVHPSGILMICTYCLAQLHQFIDLDFLTVLGILIAIISLVLLIIL